MKETNKLVDTEDNFPYKKILNVKYPFPLIKPRQQMSVRAGMFAPFAALTGYDEKIKETERYTDYEIFLDEDNKELLDKQLNNLKNDSEIKITYFVKDKNKQGGKYVTKIGKIKKIDNYNEEIVFIDKEKIKISNIIKIDIN